MVALPFSHPLTHFVVHNLYCRTSGPKGSDRMTQRSRGFPASIPILVLLALSSAPATAQGDSEDVDYDLFLGTVVDDPDNAGSAPYHLWKVVNDSSIPLQFSAAVGSVWSDLTQLDEEPATPLNVRLGRKDRLELGGRVDGALTAGDVVGFTVGIKHQIHRYFAWGLNMKTGELGERAAKEERGKGYGGSFVFIANEKHFLGTRAGMKYKLGIGLGDAISTRGAALRLALESRLDVLRSADFVGGLNGRAVSRDFTDNLGVDGLLGVETSFSGPLALRTVLSFGLAGDASQDNARGSLFLTYRP